MTSHDDRSARSPLETQLSTALAAEAARVTPSNRLEDIMERSRGTSRVGGSRSLAGGWFLAAAAAALIAGSAGVFVATRPQPPVVGGSPTGTVPTNALPSTTASASTTSSIAPPSSAPAGPTSAAALPVYVVGGEVGASGRPVLVREFQPSPGAQTPADRVATAVRIALGVDKASGYASSLPGLVDVTVGDVSSSSINVTLVLDASSPIPSTMAAAAVVYTAQAAAGMGAAPVTITATRQAGGSIPLPSTFTRMTRASFPADILASIWVDAPFPGQLLPSGKAVTVSGIASVFEASLAWEVVTAPAHGTPATVASGHTMAAGGAPARGAYSVRLPVLPDGAYEVVVRAYSAKDGSVSAERRVLLNVGVVPGG